MRWPFWNLRWPPYWIQFGHYLPSQSWQEKYYKVCVYVYGILCTRHVSILQNTNMSGTVTHANKIHQPVLHGNGQSADRVSWHHHSAVDKIKGAIFDHSNTFAVEGVRFHNIICLVYVPDEFVEQIPNSNDTGQNMFEDYVTARYSFGKRAKDVRLWQQDNRNKVSRQDDSPEWDNGSVWDINDSHKTDLRHW